MRYGESSHEAKEFEDDEIEDGEAGQVVLTGNTVPHFPRKKSNGSSLPGIGFGLRVPNSMSGVSMTTAPSIAYNPIRLHDSTPRRTTIPSTNMKGHEDLPRIGGSIFAKKKKII